MANSESSQSVNISEPDDPWLSATRDDIIKALLDFLKSLMANVVEKETVSSNTLKKMFKHEPSQDSDDERGDCSPQQSLVFPRDLAFDLVRMQGDVRIFVMNLCNWLCWKMRHDISLGDGKLMENCAEILKDYMNANDSRLCSPNEVLFSPFYDRLIAAFESTFFKMGPEKKSLEKILLQFKDVNKIKDYLCGSSILNKIKLTSSTLQKLDERGKSVFDEDSGVDGGETFEMLLGQLDILSIGLKNDLLLEPTEACIKLELIKLKEVSPPYVQFTIEKMLS